MKRKQVVRLNESQLNRIIKESINNVLNQSNLNEAQLIFDIRAYVKGISTCVNDLKYAMKHGDINYILRNELNKIDFQIEEIDKISRVLEKKVKSVNL